MIINFKNSQTVTQTVQVPKIRKLIKFFITPVLYCTEVALATIQTVNRNYKISGTVSELKKYDDHLLRMLMNVFLLQNQ